jgi:putative transcriptional regulator
MEYKDPEFELLSSLEQIVFKDVPQAITLQQKPIPLQNMSNCAKGQG